MKILLENRALLKIAGSDAEGFLQNQLSNDISKLNKSEIQINAYCQHQGKIIALFWLMRSEESFLLSFPADLAEKIKTRLQMFVIMSDVLIDDISDQYHQIGLINENHSNAYSINKNLKMDEWIANDENDYLNKLEKIILNKKELLLIKKNLRERAIKNNLFNSKEYTKNLADTLNMVWKNFAIE